MFLIMTFDFCLIRGARGPGAKGFLTNEHGMGCHLGFGIGRS